MNVKINLMVITTCFLMIGTSLMAGPWRPQNQGWAPQVAESRVTQQSSQPIDNIKSSLQLAQKRQQQAVAYDNWRKQEVKRIEIESARNDVVLQNEAERLNVIKEKADANDAKFIGKGHPLPNRGWGYYGGDIVIRITIYYGMTSWW
jgi:hypothetical protein